jgi:Domain of unknown function (DUF397)
MEAVDPRWRKSSFSGNGGDCVEVADHGNRVLVRDTKNRQGAVLRFTPGAWRRFAERVKRSLAADAIGRFPVPVRGVLAVGVALRHVKVGQKPWPPAL